MATVTLHPNGTGSTTENTLVGAATNWQAVLTNDGDTSYVRAPASLPPTSKTDLYTIDANSIPGGSTINSVTVNTVSRGVAEIKGGSTAAVIKPTIRENSTTTFGSSSTANGTYATYNNVWTTRPSDGLPFTITDITNLEIGINQIGGNISGGARTTYVEVVIDYTSVNLGSFFFD